MHFSEDDLREALKRKDPGEGFTQRLMARVNQAQSESKPLLRQARKEEQWSLHGLVDASSGMGHGCGSNACLLAFGIGGYQYSEYRHAEEMRLARERQQQLQQEAEKARDQAIMALEIARAKMNHVLRHAQLQAEPNDKIRRERL